MKRLKTTIQATFKALAGIIFCIAILGCDVNKEEAKPYVEDFVGPVTFVCQDRRYGSYEAVWYVQEMDTLISTGHNGSYWEITSSKIENFDIIKDDLTKIKISNIRKLNPVSRLYTGVEDSVRPRTKEQIDTSAWGRW